MKLYYPAIFIACDEGFTVEFPDLPGCITQGDSLKEAFEMAEDAACGWILTSIEDDEDIQSPSPINLIDTSEGFVNYVALDIDEYAKQYSTRSVKKTLTLPEWLNRLAERQGINFSQELQHALKIRLGLYTDNINECVTSLREDAMQLKQLITEVTTPFNQSSKSVTASRTTSSTIIPISFSHKFKELAN